MRTVKTLPKPVKTVKERKPTKKQIAAKERAKLRKLEHEVKALCSAACRKDWYGKCAICHRDGQNAHHFFGWKACSNLRFTLENLVWLCYGCHIGKVHQQGLTEPVREKLIDKIGWERFEKMYSEAFLRKDWTIEALQELKERLLNEQKQKV